jgi:para-aminobenzoate synthetase component 1
MLEQLNQLGKEKIPFFFAIDFDLTNYYIAPLHQMNHDILFSMAGVCNFTPKDLNPLHPHLIIKQAVSFEQYTNAFNHVHTEMKNGNTYLLNLTFPTEIELNVGLLDIFFASQAKFKLYFQDKFVVFSPERFIQIEDNIIETYPMKGTIDASIPNAKEMILANKKEQAEHTTVVDLLRNDLSMVAKQVRVKRFRYIDQIKAGHKELLQVSSTISGLLTPDWPQRLGDILLAMLPAGSITGAPKRKTIEIIKTVEGYQRGFFTGIFGYFDGHRHLDSAVMIRFIEKHHNRFFYKSGGGITIDSEVESEYQELLEKVYIPI